MAPKAALKAIKSHLDKHEYQQVVDQTSELLKEDGQNYTALLFLGAAQEKLGNLKDTESALASATRVKPDDIQAYKGLIGVYEKQDAAKLDKYHMVVQQLAQLHAHHDDRDQCQSVVDKYELFAKKHGTPAQYRLALELILPSSPLYPCLEGRVLSPALAYQRILESAEDEEKEWINAQIGERRTRLGARIEQVTKQVKQESISKFRIEQKCQALIDWTQDDDFRQEVEQKLFQRMFDNLQILSEKDKPAQRDRVLRMANDLVIIKRPSILAWKVALEWVDAESLADWDVTVLRDFIERFPDDGLSRILRSFLDTSASPFPRTNEEEQPSESEDAKLSEAEHLIAMNEGLEDISESLLGHRIVAYTYLHLEEYESASSFAKKAQKLYTEAELKYAMQLQESLDGVNLILANSLIYYQTPRHHMTARSLFQDILSRKPTLTAALLGVGLIYEEDEDYSEAAKFLQEAAQRDPENIRIRLELAWCKALDHALDVGLQELEGVLESINEEHPVNLNMKAETLYRIAFCKWHINTKPAARKDKTGPYRYLIDSVKANPNYAPAYNLLGIYFQDYGKSKQRARVALQKAFELSGAELEAAERLARTFAKNGEWDLVELVARRVINSDRAKIWPGSKRKAPSWPHAAMGVVHINKHQYVHAITSFQAALRINANDYHSWVGLGESYLNTGKYRSAERVFAQAESINHGLSADQTWFAKYMQANVNKELRDYEKAEETYEDVLKIKPDEFGVLINLLQTKADNAWMKIAQGMFGEAAKLANAAIEVALRIAGQEMDVFNLWKAVGDACSALGHTKSFAPAGNLSNIVKLLQIDAANSDLSLFSEHDGLKIELLSQTHEDDGSDSATDQFLIAAILAHKRAIHASSRDVHAQAVSWYNLGWAEHQAYISGGSLLQSKGKNPKKLLKAAMKCFKRAIELEASNSEFWNALGIMTVNLSPKVSQHSFVRSLHLNDHSARTWTNFGVLCLVNNDSQLANEAFTRAQSADPVYPEAWLGQGLVATLYGNLVEARGLFTHAFEISDSALLSSPRLYSTTAFDHIISSGSMSNDLTSLLQPLFAVRQLHNLSPADTAVAHLLALYAERVADYDTAVISLQSVCDAVESEYEKSESDECLARFAQAKADLARVQLSKHDFEAAVENAETALNLSNEDELGPSYADARRKWRLSAHVTAGVAHSRLKAIDQSIKMFQAALEESAGQADITCMLAQVLWAKGGKAEKDAARSQLFDAVERHPEHVQSVCLLATIGLVDGDADIIDAVTEDLEALRMDDGVSEEAKGRVSKVLTAIEAARRGDADGKTGEYNEAIKGIMLSPGRPEGWSELFDASGDHYANDLAKKVAGRELRDGAMDADYAASVYVRSGERGDVQDALMMAPWKAGNDAISYHVQEVSDQDEQTELTIR